MEEATPAKKINWTGIYILIIAALIIQVFFYYLLTIYFR